MNEHWLNARRLRVYPWIFLSVFLLVSVYWLLASRNGLDPLGKPLGADFITYWAASWLGLYGDAVDAYELLRIHAVEQMVAPGAPLFAWLYPPTYLLMILPLALLPYTAAWLAFMTATLLPFWLLMRCLLTGRRGCLLLVVAFPGFWINLLHGQNAGLTTALAGGALLLMRSRPWLAGLLVALLSVKPHMVALFPLAFLLAGAWRAMFSAALCALVLIAVSILAFGLPTWLAWQEGLQIARALNEDGALPWAKMPTVFAALRMLDVPVALAYAGQLLSAGAAALLMIVIWRRTSELALRGSAFVLATLLISPHFFDYDLLWLALPLAWLGVRGLTAGWLRGERELLVLAWLLPLIGPALASATGLQLMPVVNLLLLLVVWRKLGDGAHRISCGLSSGVNAIGRFF